MVSTAARNRGSSSRTTFQMSDGDSDAYWWRRTLPMSRTPTHRISACFSLSDSGTARLASETNQKRALDDVLDAPVHGKLFES
jgi:hypothetical protein